MEDALLKLSELHNAALDALAAAKKYADEKGLEYYYSIPDSESEWESSWESSQDC